MSDGKGKLPLLPGPLPSLTTGLRRNVLDQNLGSSPWVGLETHWKCWISYPTKGLEGFDFWFWAFDCLLRSSAVWSLGMGCGGSSDCLIREVETAASVQNHFANLKNKEAYNILEMNDNCFEMLNTCLPLCLLFSRLAARKEVMPWTLPLIKWPKRPETCADR